jgi:hypothetical protein
MKKLLALTLLAGTAFAQTKEPTLEQLKTENAQLKKQNAYLAFALSARDATAAFDAREKAKKELEALFPGKHWDEQKQTLVDNPPVKAEAKVEPKAEKK